MHKAQKRNKFSVKSIVDVLNQEKKVVKKVFGPFWNEGETCLLFAGSGVGKTILGYDIAMSIANNTHYWPEDMSEVHVPVLYCDLEMSEDQFCKRYEGCKKDLFVNNIFRFTADDCAFELNPENFISGVKDQIKRTGAKVLIIDNISCVLGNPTEKIARKFMNDVRALRNKYHLSVMVIGHTTKGKAGKPITQDALGGSKMLVNFCDSACALSRSEKGISSRYLKQVKSRSTAELDGVAELRLTDDPYVHFEFVEYNEEEDHLPQKGHKKDGRVKFDEAARQSVIDLHRQKMSVRKISEQTGIPKSTVCDIIHKLDSGESQVPPAA